MRAWILSVALLFLVVPNLADANVCVYRPPKVRQLHGIVLDTSNEPIPGVVVSILREKEIIESSTTGDDGVFALRSLPDGKYTIHTEARGFIDSGYEVVLQNHTDHWKRVIEIKLAVGMDYCVGSISIVQKAPTKR